MSDCNGTALYCYPTEGQVLRENATYILEWNAKWETLSGVPDVDVLLLRNASPPELAQKIPSLPNDGVMSFTIDNVFIPPSRISSPPVPVIRI